MKQIQPLMNHMDIKQVGMVVRDMEKTIEQMRSLWNIEQVRIFEPYLPDATVHGKTTRVRAKLAFIQAGSVEFELIEPGDGENIYWEFLRDKGEGVHHIAFHVSDIESELTKFQKRGIEVLQKGTDQNGVTFAYVDTERICGIIVELLQFKQNPA
jgi:methylmalonyl-CoA/ethylmalonyl-CoA epimerase